MGYSTGGRSPFNRSHPSAGLPPTAWNWPRTTRAWRQNAQEAHSAVWSRGPTLVSRGSGESILTDSRAAMWIGQGVGAMQHSFRGGG